MALWTEFTAAAPALASDIRELLYQYGPGLAYLATVRPDGGPRIHPISPVIVEDGLFCFVVDSPKRRDLLRDGRYALHAYPAETSEDEAYLAGRAGLVGDAGRARRVADAVRATARVDWLLFELDVEVAMLVRRPAIPCAAGPGGTASGAVPPERRTIWRDSTRALEVAS